MDRGHNIYSCLCWWHPDCTTAPQILHPIYISKPTGSEKTQGSHRGSNPGPPALATGAMTPELRLPHDLHLTIKLWGDGQPHTQSNAQGVCWNNERVTKHRTPTLVETWQFRLSLIWTGAITFILVCTCNLWFVHNYTLAMKMSSTVSTMPGNAVSLMYRIIAAWRQSHTSRSSLLHTIIMKHFEYSRR